MKTIHKYTLSTKDEQKVLMPQDAIILCVQVQYGAPCIWAEVDTGEPIVPVKIRTYGTGHSLDVPSHSHYYLGTYQLQGGALVFHVYQVDD